jgi:hypothetical protein
MSFFKEGKRLSNNYVHENFTPKRIFIMAHENPMPGVVDMLRNEKPVRVKYYSPTVAFIITGKEPVGEEEKQATQVIGLKRKLLYRKQLQRKRKDNSLILSFFIDNAIT